MAKSIDPLSTTARWRPAANEEEQREVLEHRLRLFAKLAFFSFWILVGFTGALYWAYPGTESVNADLVWAVAAGGLALMAAVWYFGLIRRRRSIAVLRFIETFFTLVIGATFGFLAFSQIDKPPNGWAAFLFATYTIFGRVLIIPSTGARTFWLSSLAYAPMIGAVVLINHYHPNAVGLPPPALLVGVLFLGTCTVILATTGSQVLYGLRKQVREAMRLGQYILGDKIGEGGMGAVYKASHTMLRRPTAIKLLRPGKNTSLDLERFEREVQLTSELTHPNTIAIFDYGRSPDGVFYYAMEYLGGTDLETLVRAYGAQPPDRVINILRQVCGALDEAHSRDFIHRDIKPANILLCQRGRVPDIVKVVDFGLVKEVGSQGLSGSNIIAGTPAYLSPEAVIHPDRVGPASDLYAVGAVAYFLLTASTVFQGATPVDVCLKHVEESPTPPSQRVSTPIPPALEAIIMQCLEKDPADRPESAMALRAALGKISKNGGWDRETALQWWSEFEAGTVETGSAPSTIVSAPATMTVDLHDRTAVELGLADEPGEV